ncbi:hypothetical protein [Clostridium thailandense]|uniref:Uncharacterized protein n=1 Tax=Clostridium thailandense TaxID=2794346 RepID=A0A949TMS8_9CLOT|nr:hypothetical protein [Clostridium thailandense]MBV7272157.1 hypothetical protein [Clostridium thailandense]MCH5135991.1 hypothetical protein [Clostridiaceae bacterium UIB06]
MFVVYSNRQMLPIIKEVEYSSRGTESEIGIRLTKVKNDYYDKILEEIDEEYIKEYTSG